jgi:hypothetical protein
MSHAHALSNAKLKLFERFFSDASPATVETMEILMDMDQMTSMLTSFEDLRKGRVLSMADAFADL